MQKIIQTSKINLQSLSKNKKYTNFSLAITLALSSNACFADYDPEHWMEEVFSGRANVPFNEIIIPGTHDSGSYDISSSSKVDEECSDNVLKSLTSSITADWAQTQTQDFKQQLEGGIRYFDLRITKEDGEPWLWHCMLSVKLSEALEDINNFAASHPKEIIILDFQDIEVSSMIDDVHSLITNKFGSRLISSSVYKPDSPLQNLWNSGDNIIVVGNDRDDGANGLLRYSPNTYWDRGDDLKSDWANTDNDDDLYDEVSESLASRNMNELTVAQTVLTPDSSDILNLTFSDLRELNDDIDHKIGTWMGTWNCDGIKPNIVMTDFYQDSSVVKTAIGLNSIEGAPDTEILAGTAEDGDQLGYSLATGDFNHDGYMDLAMGVPYEDIGTLANAGAVNIIYGGPDGLAQRKGQCQIFHEDSPNVVGNSEAGDKFGKSLSSGDYNQDGYADLAIGSPGETINGYTNAGKVTVLFGGTNGLNGIASKEFHQNVSGIPGSVEAGDQFGFALSSADFNNDGYTDLAIGAPYEDIGSLSSAGSVIVINGSLTGLNANSTSEWHQNISGINGTAEAGDEFGYALASGDFNYDGNADLAIGVPGEAIGNDNDAGAINVIYANNSGLSSSNDQDWHQDTSGIKGRSEPNDRFGQALASDDFDNDGYDDLAIGVPGEDSEAGAVNVIYGSASRLNEAKDQVWEEDTSGIKGDSESDDHFGYSLSAEDFDNDGYADLAIGAPWENLSSADNDDEGEIHVLYGRSSGLSDDDQIWSQDENGIKGTSEQNDNFGFSLISGDFNGDGKPDLAIGANKENTSKYTNEGQVHVLYSDIDGISSKDQIWHQKEN